MTESAFKSDVLRGKTALVTGGGSGICYGITKKLLAHGARAVIVGRKADRLTAAAAELEKDTGQTCLATPADVRDPAAIGAAVDRAVSELGGLDILVNGAAGNFLAPAAQLSANGFRTVMDIDACGTFNASRAAFDKAMRDRGGIILNISATLHYAATPMQIHASAAKAAVDAITRTLAAEWASLGIRVNGIAPGPIDETEGMSRLAPGELRDKLTSKIPIKRFGTIDEIANVALFLCTDAASLIHGATIVADGAAWLGMSAALGD
jgi:2,4-dienoyl-CoA reductase [(3E)-enoyl-CoA-producing], peroxisomal